jgi:hypothetical protein
VSDLVDIGSAKLNDNTGMVTAQCKGVEHADGQSPDYGDVNLCFALGFAAVPAPANENGSAQGLVLDDVPGQDGVCIGAVDSRTTQTYYELKSGETAVFSTGEGFDSRILFKDGLVAIVVDDDKTIIIDRKNKKTQIVGHGCLWEQSEANGTVLTDETGAASIQLKDGKVMLIGTVVQGGRVPMSPMGLPGTPSLPAPGVFYGK